MKFPDSRAALIAEAASWMTDLDFLVETYDEFAPEAAGPAKDLANIKKHLTPRFIWREAYKAKRFIANGQLQKAFEEHGGIPG